MTLTHPSAPARNRVPPVSARRTGSLAAIAVLACVAAAGCSSETRSSISSDVESAVTEVGQAISEGTDAAAEALARNIATQQGEEQFTNAGHRLSGPLTCEAKIDEGIARIEISCAGTDQAGGAALLTGATTEIPGASVVALDGQFTGTIDGVEVFTTQRLGG